MLFLLKLLQSLLGLISVYMWIRSLTFPQWQCCVFPVGSSLSRANGSFVGQQFGCNAHWWGWEIPFVPVCSLSCSSFPTMWKSVGDFLLLNFELQLLPLPCVTCAVGSKWKTTVTGMSGNFTISQCTFSISLNSTFVLHCPCKQNDESSY